MDSWAMPEEFGEAGFHSIYGVRDEDLFFGLVGNFLAGEFRRQ